jgi:hypothetical protein
VSLDDAGDVAVLVAREDEEAPRIVTHRLVLPARHLEHLAAVLPRALADEADQERVVAVVPAQACLELDDPLVDLAEERLVARTASLFLVHSDDSLGCGRFSPPGTGQAAQMSTAERAAENESTFRELNEKLQKRADELDVDGGRIPFLCECDEERCTHVVLLTRDEYEDVRSHPRTFVLTSGHQAPDDRVVRDEPDYVVVEKTGEKGPLVEARNPRA